MTHIHTHQTHTSRRERRSLETRERLFRASLDLFAKKGFPETTVEDITNAADVGKGTFFNYFPSKDHILLAFGEMQLARLQSAVQEARHTRQPIPQFLSSLAERMTQEPAKHPDIKAMLDLQDRVLAVHTEMIQMGQDRGEIRKDLPAAEIALVFRQTVFGTLLIWSLYGDSSLKSRMDSAFEVVWSGLLPRSPNVAPASPSNFSHSGPVAPLFI
jgi:AcrR family transcriptional regulator